MLGSSYNSQKQTQLKMRGLSYRRFCPVHQIPCAWYTPVSQSLKCNEHQDWTAQLKNTCAEQLQVRGTCMLKINPVHEERTNEDNATTKSYSYYSSFMFLCVLFVRKRRPPDLRPVFSIELPTARLRQSQGSRWSAVPTSNGEQVWPLSNAKKAKLKSWAKLRTSWNPLAITGLLLEITLLWVRLLVPTLEPGGIFKAMVNRQINPRYSEISMAPYRCVFKSVHAKVKEDSIFSSGAS